MQMSLPDFDSLWDYDHPDSTEKTFRTILPMAVITGDLSYRIQLLTQIARAQGLQRQFSEAHRTLDQASLLLVEFFMGGAATWRRGLLERGRVFNTAGNKERARDLFMKAWLLASSIGEDGYAIDAAHMMGIVEPPADQLTWNLKALEMAERSPDERAQKWCSGGSGGAQRAARAVQRCLRAGGPRAFDAGEPPRTDGGRVRQVAMDRRRS